MDARRGQHSNTIKTEAIQPLGMFYAAQVASEIPILAAQLIIYPFICQEQPLPAVQSRLKTCVITTQLARG